METEEVRQRINSECVKIIYLKNNKYVMSYFSFAPLIFDTFSASDDEDERQDN